MIISVFINSSRGIHGGIGRWDAMPIPHVGKLTLMGWRGLVVGWAEPYKVFDFEIACSRFDTSHGAEVDKRPHGRCVFFRIDFQRFRSKHNYQYGDSVFLVVVLSQEKLCFVAWRCVRLAVGLF